MTAGEFITDRWMERIISEVCAQENIAHEVYSYGWVHRLERDGVVRYIDGYQMDINRAASTGISSDKVAAHQVLAAAGLSSVEHFLLRKSPATGQFRWYGEPYDDMVVKPNDGSGGIGVARYQAKQAVEQILADSDNNAWAVSPYLEIASEVRTIVLDGQVLLSYEKQGVMRDGLCMFNLGQGAVPVPYVLNETEKKLAIDGMTAIGLRLGAVDSVMTTNGETYILEINSGFMMEHYMRSVDGGYDRGLQFYRQAILAMFDGLLR